MAVAHLVDDGPRVDAELHLVAGKDAYFLYFRCPWGAMMELISYPHGRAYEAGVERTLWNPGKPRE